MGDMTPYCDSTDLLGDGAALGARLARDGYLLIRGLLPSAEVLAVRRRFLQPMAAAGWLAPNSAVDAAIAVPDKACVDPEEPFVEVLRQFYRRPDGHALKLHANIIGLFERLFGEPVLAHPLLIPRCIFPQRPDFTTPSHQDFPHIQGTADTYSLWLPLGDCPAEMGGLAIASGSHTEGVRDFTLSNGAGAMEVLDPLEGTWVHGPVAAGDVLIFHSLTVHKGVPNGTDRLRLSLDNRYQRASEPICARCLEPYAGCGSWAEITADWPAEAPAYYWRDQAPTIADYDMQYYQKRDQIAFELAEERDPVARAALMRIIQRDPAPAKRDRAAGLLAFLDATRDYANAPDDDD